MKEGAQSCPMCGKCVNPSQRYPKYFCNSCVELATDNSGRKVEFFNSHFMGAGCTARYAGTEDEHYPTNKCFIKGMECRALDGYFGGIVIQPLAAWDEYFQAERPTEPWPVNG